MSHFYEKTETGIILRNDVTTVPQCRKANKTSEGPVVASVTTKLGVLPNDFLDLWKLKEAAKIARDDLDIELDDIPKEVWGRRRTPAGIFVYSSDFGTKLHGHLEDACNAYKKGDTHSVPDGWHIYTDPFMDWLEYGEYCVLECEYMVADRHSAGMIDLIVEDFEGKICLMDFKTRLGKGNLKSKAYDKDCAQLAIEASIYANDMELDYIPRIWSILIDCETAEMHPKLWTVKAQAKGLETYNHCSTFYDNINGLR